MGRTAKEEARWFTTGIAGWPVPLQLGDALCPSLIDHLLMPPGYLRTQRTVKANTTIWTLSYSVSQWRAGRTWCTDATASDAAPSITCNCNGLRRCSLYPPFLDGSNDTTTLPLKMLDGNRPSGQSSRVLLTRLGDCPVTSSLT
ncbi:hypothetical protein FDECE_16809 [Fusarium decemcellulare]|nr:hypothetical protein FDECE_16809 [Fusarium decemcellulare]